MATFKSDMVNGNQSFKPFPSGNVGVRYAKLNVTAALNAADVYQMVDVFAGTGLVLDVGDATDADRFIDGSTIGQAGGTDHEDGNLAPVTYTADDTIDITCQVAPAGDVATGTLEMWIYIS